MIERVFLERQVRSLPTYFPGLDALSPEIVYLMGCRRFNQFCCTWRSLVDPSAYCPFCEQELVRRGRKPLRVSGNWMVLANEFPRDDAQMMLLIVPKYHLTSDAELGGADYEHIGILRTVCRDDLGFRGGAFVMRAGDPRDHAGTIEHIHENVIQPTRQGGLTIPLAKTQAEHVADYQRLQETFVDQLDKKGGFAWMFSAKGIVETQPPLTT